MKSVEASSLTPSKHLFKIATQTSWEYENTLQAWNLCGINEREQASRPTQTHNWERQHHCQ